MSPTTHSSHIPHLRFSGFFGEWEEKKLREVKINISSGVSVNSIDEPVKNLNEFGILKTSAVVGGKFMPNENKKILEYELERATLNPKKDTILVSRMNTPALVGESGYIEEDFDNLFIPDRLWSLEINENNSAKFISILISSSSAMSKISNIATGTSNSMKNISQPNFLNLIFSFPSLPEQTKIASFLSVVDEKITHLTDLKSSRESYKSGIMQQIFSQEIRFSGYSDEWEEKKLGEIATKQSSNISMSKIEGNKGDFIIYGASGIVQNIDFYEEENDYISIVKDGAGVGRLLYCKGKSSVLGTMEIIKPKIKIDPYFLYLILSQINFIKYITGSTIPHIYFKDYSKENILLPSLAEQEKIADFLSQIDTKIEEFESQIEQAKKWKKGLLQGLFI